MYQVAPSTSSASPIVNGHLATPPAFDQPNRLVASDSESDLSEAIDPPNTLLSSPHANNPENGILDTRELSDSEPSADEDAMGSDDAEYELDNSPPGATQNAATHNTRSTSETSSKLGKRKASADDEEDFMINDPELYGLRRSGRARPSRRVVESESDSDSDVQTRPRKRQRAYGSVDDSKQPSPSAPSDTESNSERTTSKKSRSRNPAGQSRRRRLVQSAMATPPPQVHARFSTRQAAKVSNYNEDEGDTFEDEDDRGYEWVAAPDGIIHQVDEILKHRLREDTSKEASDLEKQDYEYFVKWVGKAHYHATWQTYGSLVEFKGQRKAENYFNKKILEDLRLERGEEMSPDEKESRLLQRENETHEVEENTKVERVVAMQEDDDGNIEYFVKWKRVPYEGCTWEEAGLISRIAQNEVDRYLERTASLPISSKPTRRSEPMHEQPHYIKNGVLRDFQKTGINFLALNWQKGRSAILADEMGLGKTVQTVSFLNWLRHDRLQQGPFLVIVPLSTMPSWADTFDHWTPDINYVVYNGKKRSRDIIQDFELFVPGTRKPKFNVLLTTYEYVIIEASYLAQIKWQFMAVDEAHRLKSRQSQLYNKLLEFKAPHKLLITGTPVQNDLSELSALLHFINPTDAEADINIDFLQPEEASRKLQILTSSLEPIMIRRTKKTVEKDLPPKTEKIIRVELADVQLEYYKNILTRNYAALNEGAKGPKQSLLNIMMELKKASNHPFLFPSAEARILGDKTGHEEVFRSLVTSSGKMMLLDGLLKKLHKNGHRVLIFSQMVKMLDILQDYMRCRGYQFQRLDGTIPSAQRTQAMEHFNKPESPDFCFLLSTRAGGLGINLMTADTVILFDSDWNPQADLQAMARAHRIGQIKPVSIFRLVAKETIEEEVLERARNKLMLEHITIERGITDKESNDKLQDKLAKAKKGADAPNSAEDISRILRRRGQKMFEQSSSQKRLEELDIDSVLENAEEHQTEDDKRLTGDGGEDFLKQFEYTDVKLDLEWDQIIPKEALAEIKAAEEKKAHQQFLDDQIQANAPRKRKNEGSDRDERAAKKRAINTVAHEAANSSESAEDLDPDRPLTEKETRDLTRSYLRFGAIDDERGDDVIRESRLGHRNRDFLRQVLKDYYAEGVAQKAKGDKEIRDREQATGKMVPQKERKPVIFPWRGTQRNNADTICEREGHIRLLRKAVSQVPDFQSFRIPEAQKGAETYTVPWGPREDGMLCVGVVRHGFLAWAEIRNDPELGLTDKIFLKEQQVGEKKRRQDTDDKTVKTPQAVHLVRRMAYLMSVLEDKMSDSPNPAAKRAVENHHRNNKKNGMHTKTNSRTAASASPAPSSGVKKHREAEKHRPRSSAERRISTGESNGHAVRLKSASRRTPQTADVKGQVDGSHDGERPITSVPGYCKLLLAAVRDNLAKLMAATKSNQPNRDARAHILRTELATVGDHVMTVLDSCDDSPEVRSKLESDLWEHVLHYWPNNNVTAAQIRSMWRRIRSIPADGSAAPAQAPEQAESSRRKSEITVSGTDGQVNGTSTKSE
ncbi:MAG: hypothetical protein Q9183_001891 [Haloplaca sp. 2 TL-2023]